MHGLVKTLKRTVQRSAKAGATTDNAVMEAAVAGNKDPMAKAAQFMQGKANLPSDGVLAGLDGDSQGPKQASMNGEPLKWVMGDKAPLMHTLKSAVDDTLSETMKLNKRAPKSKENKEILDAATNLKGELGQFETLAQMAQASGASWHSVAIHAGGQLFEAVAKVSAMSQLLKSVSPRSGLPDKLSGLTGRLRAGRLAVQTGEVPYKK